MSLLPWVSMPSGPARQAAKRRDLEHRVLRAARAAGCAAHDFARYPADISEQGLAILGVPLSIGYHAALAHADIRREIDARRAAHKNT